MRLRKRTGYKVTMMYGTSKSLSEVFSTEEEALKAVEDLRQVYVGRHFEVKVVTVWMP